MFKQSDLRLFEEIGRMGKTGKEKISVLKKHNGRKENKKSTFRAFASRAKNGWKLLNRTLIIPSL